jgi:DNA-directed RNA polymerase subunit beta'
MRTTIGNILFNEALPKPLRDYKRQITGRNIGDLLTNLADKYPEEYSDTIFTLKKLGDNTSYSTAHSVKLDDFAPPPEKKKIMEDTFKQLSRIPNTAKTPEQAENQFARIMGTNKTKLEKAVISRGIKNKSGLAEMVLAKSRGSPDQLNSIVGSPMAVQDANNKTITVPILNSYSEGLDPAEYWAASYGTRKGVLSTKVSTAEGGYFGKRLAAPVHRLIVSTNDCGTKNGIVEEPDGDILDTFLAKNIGPYKRNDLVSRGMIDVLKKKNIRHVLIRSPLTCEADEGLCAKCRGIIETGKEAKIGQNVGINSALTISEPVAQGALNVKHKGGALEEKHLINIDLETMKRLVDVPKNFPDASILSEETGAVTNIRTAPQGGHFIYVNEEEHYVPQKRKILVKKGDRVKAGDQLSDGIINPSEVVRLKGMGPARVWFTKYYKDMYKQAYGANLHQKHFETFARGMLNYVHVKDAENSDEILPGDKITIQKANKVFKPKKSRKAKPSSAIGSWLAKPYLHYPVGSKVDKDLVADLKKIGINEIEVTDSEPAFEPVMLALNALPAADPDWMRRLGGERLRKSILDAVSKGEKSDIHGASYIPGLVYGAEFGEVREKGKY